MANWVALRVKNSRSRHPQTLVINNTSRQLGIVDGNYLQTQAHKWQLISVIVFGFITVPYMLAVKWGWMPKLLLPNLGSEIIVMGVFLAMPFLINLVFNNALPAIKEPAIQAFDGGLKRFLFGWEFEQLWVWSVLIILPPTIIMFIVLFFTKTHDIMEPMLVTLHLSLFLRRANNGFRSRFDTLILSKSLCNHLA